MGMIRFLLRLAVSKPVTTAYPGEIALVDRGLRGTPTLVADRCRLTGACQEACPTDAIWFGTYEEFRNRRRGNPVETTRFGSIALQTRVNFVLPPQNETLDVIALLQASVTEGRPAREEAWVL